MINIKRVFQLALLTSFASKTSGLFYQILAIPLIIVALGGEGFGLFMIYSGLSTWLNVISSGVAPMLTTLVARNESSKRIQDSFIATNTYIILCFTLIGIVCSLYFSKSIALYLGEKEWRTVFLVYLTMVSYILFSTAESINQGLHKQYLNNIIFCVGSILNLLFVYIVVIHLGLTDVFSLFAASQLGLIVVKLLNWIYVIRKIVCYRLGNLFDPEIIRDVVGVTGSFILIQLSVVFFQQGLILIMYGYSKELSGMLGLVFRLYAILGSFLTMINQPLWPIIVNAINNNKLKWVLKLYLKVYCLYFLFGMSCLIILIIFGVQIFESWSAGEYQFEKHDLIFIGIHIFLISLNQANSSVLMGLSNFKFLGFIMFFESTLALLVITYLMSFLEVELYMVITISCTVNIFTSFWMAPRKIYNTLKK